MGSGKTAKRRYDTGPTSRDHPPPTGSRGPFRPSRSPSSGSCVVRSEVPPPSERPPRPLPAPRHRRLTKGRVPSTTLVLVLLHRPRVTKDGLFGRGGTSRGRRDGSADDSRDGSLPDRVLLLVKRSNRARPVGRKGRDRVVGVLRPSPGRRVSRDGAS